MALLRNLLARALSIDRSTSPPPEFRKPIEDFGVAATEPRALAVAARQRPERGPFVAEDGDFLSLHFGSSTALGVHAIMDRAAPNDLVFSYTQVMAGFERFVPDPRTIGILGLGGGSLAKHCWLQFPHARITVAEISPEVIALRDRFLLPADDARFRVLAIDGLDLVAGSRKAFDVLLIDVFNEDGHLACVGSGSFYTHCRRALTSRGVLVLNFSGEAWQAGSQEFLRTFPDRNVLYRCPDGDNIIAFATRGALPAWLGE